MSPNSQPPLPLRFTHSTPGVARGRMRTAKKSLREGCANRTCGANYHTGGGGGGWNRENSHKRTHTRFFSRIYYSCNHTPGTHVERCLICFKTYLQEHTRYSTVRVSYRMSVSYPPAGSLCFMLYQVLLTIHGLGRTAPPGRPQPVQHQSAARKRLRD